MGKDVYGFGEWPEVLGGVFIPLFQLTWTLIALVAQGLWWLIKAIIRR